MERFSTKQVTLDLEEYNLLIGQLDIYRKKPEDGSLTKEEQEEATGMLLTRALQNPGLFRTNLDAIDLGIYKAIFVITPDRSPALSVRFVRT